jgi:hypothetical protein
MTDGFKSREEVVKDQIGSFMMHAMRKHEENIMELLKGIEAAETMLRGIPNIVSAMADLARIDEEHAAALAQVIEASASAGGAYDVVSDAEGALARAQKNTIEQQRILAKSVRACAKTQVTLAKYLKHALTMLLVYVGSQDFLKNASEGACKVGRGDDAIREFARQKFGDALTGGKNSDDSPDDA